MTARADEIHRRSGRPLSGRSPIQKRGPGPRPEASSPGVRVGPGVRAVAAEEPRESTEPSAQIIGGSRVTIEQYPWQVAIARAPAVAPPGDGPLERHICGGTLVA